MLSLPPTLNADDIARVDELRFRRRLLYGQHQRDIEDAVCAMFGAERSARMVKAVDTSANAAQQLYAGLAALYNGRTRVQGPSETTIAAVEAAGHWVRMVRNQRDALCYGDLAIIASNEGGRIDLRTVSPDLWVPPRAKRGDPKAIGYFGAWVASGPAWELWEYQSEDESGNPAWGFRRRSQAEYERCEETPWTPWAWIGPQGPYMPVVLYHAADTGTLMDWQSGCDVTRGCVRLMVYYTHLGHALSEASWPQRVLIDGDVESGAEVLVESNAMTVVTDPATVLKVRSHEGKTAQVTQWSTSADVEGLFRVIAMYSRIVATSAGVRTPDATRSESDIRSGYSLAVSRESVAEQQRIYAPVFGASDRELLHVCALLLGEPSDGPAAWSVAYQPVELGPVELQSRIAAIKAMRELGLVSEETALRMLHPGWDDAQIASEMTAIALERAEPAPPANNNPGVPSE